ncbi:hypothetical protein BD779DRAFT_1544916 [Infundibulicybe gibba]|nr:hypothetical protein BD779DRAFT_1544916 [Infundibulicybe gibba]
MTGTNLVSPSSCRIFMWIFIITGCITIAVTQAIVAREIFNQWERRKIVARLLVIMSTIGIPALFVIAVECTRIDLRSLLVSPGAMFCGFSPLKSPWIQAAFGLLAGFDLIIILLVILNAMERPRRTDHDLIFALHRDGAAMYTVRGSYTAPS